MPTNDREKDAGMDRLKPDEHGHLHEGPEAAPVPAEPTPEAAGGQALARALKGSFAVLKVGMIALVAFYFLSGIFYVQPQEVKFKLRFGDIVPVGGNLALRSGRPHIRMPWHTIETVSTDEKTLELTTEYWTDPPRDPGQRLNSLDLRQNGYLITGDVNIVHARLRVRYRVRHDAEGAMSYLFAISEPTEILKRALMESVVKAVGSMEIMEVIKRQNVLDDIMADLQNRVADFEKKAGVPLGIEVRAVEAVDVERIKNPCEPFRVREAFAEAQNAGSLREQAVEQGRAESNAIVADAQAKCTEILARAQGDRAKLVESARADANAMRELLPIYSRTPEDARIVRETFYKRTIQNVLQGAKGVFVLYQPGPGTERELRILLGKPPALGGQEAQGEPQS